MIYVHFVQFHDEICVLNKSAVDEGVISYDEELMKKKAPAKDKEKEVASFQKVCSHSPTTNASCRGYLPIVLVIQWKGKQRIYHLVFYKCSYT